jgi:hypothetical protein
MRYAIGLPCGSFGRQRKDSTLPDKVCRRIVLVQLREDWSKSLPECSSSVGVESFSFIYTTKCVSTVKRDS